MSWARPLEAKRGRAVNPHTNIAWFDILEDTLETIDPDLIYAVDEIGCLQSGGHKERVMEAVGPGPQYQQRDRNRENTTVLVTICSDGTSTPPAIIMKGSAYQVKWAQDNAS